MGYAVEVRGRVRLPLCDEPRAAQGLRLELVRHRGWLAEDDEVRSLADLATYACAAIERDGDWLDFVALDDTFDSKWSPQASAFYVALVEWVSEGALEATGEDEAVWAFHYGPDGMEQVGTNAYDRTGPGTVPRTLGPERET